MQFVTSSRLECAWSAQRAFVGLCGFLPACTMNRTHVVCLTLRISEVPPYNTGDHCQKLQGFNKYLISINFWSLIVLKPFILANFMSLILFGCGCYMALCPMSHSLGSWNLEEAVDTRILLFENLIITSWYLSPLLFLFPSFILPLGYFSELYCTLRLSEAFLKQPTLSCVSPIY